MKKLGWILLQMMVALPAGAADAEKTAYAQLLQKVAAEQGVRWNRFGPEEKKQLETFLGWIDATNPAMLGSRNEQLAFWINAHNACVMKFISDRMPVEDVMAIPGFRDRLQCKIAGAEHSLVEIESGILRPMFNEPRIHFVLWWGARGSPRLSPLPFDGKTIQKGLEDASKKTVRDPAYVRIEPKKGRFDKPVKLSPLFDWYKADFGKEGALGFIRKRLPEAEAKKVPLRLSDAAFTPFDWKLDAVTE